MHKNFQQPWNVRGLIFNQALIQAHTNQKLFGHVTEHTRGILFLGTPHRGSSFSDWGSIFARALLPLGSNPSLLQEVAYDSLPLFELHKSFEGCRSENLQVVNFFEQRKVRLLKLWFVQWEKFVSRPPLSRRLSAKTHSASQNNRRRIPVAKWTTSVFLSTTTT